MSNVPIDEWCGVFTPFVKLRSIEGAESLLGLPDTELSDGELRWLCSLSEEFLVYGSLLGGELWLELKKELVLTI